jgi:hypothetical protein
MRVPVTVLVDVQAKPGVALADHEEELARLAAVNRTFSVLAGASLDTTGFAIRAVGVKAEGGGG